MHRRLALLTAAAATAACGDSTSPGSQATFAFVVQGDANGAVRGDTAVFGGGVDPFNGDSTWVLDLHAGSGNDLQGVAFLTLGGRPAAGSHPIVPFTEPSELEDGSFGSVVVLSPTDEVPIGFVGDAVSGTLTISSSTAEQVKGSFEMEAAGVAGETTETVEDGRVTVAGTFTAVPLAVLVPSAGEVTLLQWYRARALPR
jgi:hypothetical protein